MRMDKNILAQYADMQQEIKELRGRIEQKKRRISEMEKKGYTVKDAVKGTRPDGINGSIRIVGFPNPEYKRQKSLLQASLLRMQRLEEKLLDLTNKAEEYIFSIEGSKVRQIMMYRYLDDLNWVQVAHRMGKKYTPDSCRKIHERFFEKK